MSSPFDTWAIITLKNILCFVTLTKICTLCIPNLPNIYTSLLDYPLFLFFCSHWLPVREGFFTISFLVMCPRNVFFLFLSLSTSVISACILSKNYVIIHIFIGFSVSFCRTTYFLSQVYFSSERRLYSMHCRRVGLVLNKISALFSVFYCLLKKIVFIIN